METWSIRRMTRDDLPAAHALTRAVGWSHRLADWEFHFRLGSGWVVRRPEGGIVGTGLWWSWGDGLGTLGLIVVDPAAQGQGIGARLMQSLIESAHRPSLMLVATEAGLKLYRRFGFHDTGGIEQRQGDPRRELPPGDAAGLSLRRTTASDLDVMVQLDAAAFGARRDRLVAAILADGQGVLAMAAGQPAGFALSRPSGKGTLIGPVVAPEQATAVAMIRALIPSDRSFARVDIPADATDLASWLDAAGLPRVDRVTSMLRGDAPPRSASARTFGLASQAFG